MGTVKYLMMFVLMLTTIATSACDFMNKQSKPPVEINWDLSESHRLSDVGWTPETTGNFYSRHEDMLMTLKLPGGKIFKDKIRAFNCHQRDGENLASIAFKTDKMTIDQAYEEARRLILYWNLDLKNLEQWRQERKENKKVIDDRFETMKNNITPSYAVRILDSFNDEKPWYISFEISF